VGNWFKFPSPASEIGGLVVVPIVAIGILAGMVSDPGAGEFVAGWLGLAGEGSGSWLT